ncbi:MAG: Trk system potassium transporter TrkA [Candidatus Methanoplasma sp.]|jgi:trk system potassium uptake protein TrkA|nr:Trk system potassium transporter TrkA [Candidatus Methanoplasma sp.]
MNVIIVGAGNVGSTSADALSKAHDVLIIEKDPEKVDNARASINASVLHDDGSNPKVLEAAIDRVDADVMLSAVPDDSLNLFICLMAKRIKPSIITVACLRDPDYIVKTAEEGEAGIDILVSPELITAGKIEKLATLENAVSYDDVSNLGVALATFRIRRNHGPVGKVVMDLPLPEDCDIIAIYRGDSVILNCETAEIHADDRICVLGSHASIEQVNKIVGIDKEAKEFVILGASIVGIEVAKSLLKSGKKRFIKIIEKDENLCRYASRELDNAIIVNADFVDPSVLRSENVHRADVVISASAMDERNLLACMAALRFGTKKIISKYSKREYEGIFKYTGIESIIGYHRVISNEVTKHLVFDDRAILNTGHEGEYFFASVLDKHSILVGNRLGDVNMPEGMRIAAVMRGGEPIYPHMDTMFMPNDKVLVFTYMANPVEITRLLGQKTPLGL